MTTVTASNIGTAQTTTVPVVLRRPSWGAVFAGAVAAMGIQMLLTVLGLAIGLTAAEGGADGGGMTTAAGWWWFLTGIVSLAIGGMIVGRLVGLPRSLELAVHGFAMWAITAVLGFVLLWSSAGMAALAGTQAASSNWAQQWSSGMAGGSSTSITESITRDPVSTRQADSAALTAPGGEQAVTADRAQDAAQSASWWTFLALLLGAGVSVGAAWFAAPQPAGEWRRPLSA